MITPELEAKVLGITLAEWADRNLNLFDRFKRDFLDWNPTSEPSSPPPKPEDCPVEMDEDWKPPVIEATRKFIAEFCQGMETAGTYRIENGRRIPTRWPGISEPATPPPPPRPEV